MTRFAWIVAATALVIVIVVGVGIAGVQMPGSWNHPALAQASDYNGLVPAEKLLRVPVSDVFPGGNTRGLAPDIQNPLANDPDAATRGMQDFDSFNCSGCHMANGGGGMGPALSDHVWFHRDSPANLYLDIAQGRSNGMPAFGAMLPDRTIWELVAYIQKLSASPRHSFGVTTSATPSPPPVEQVPAGQTKSPTPWATTEPMPSNGEKNGTDERPDAPLPPGAEQAQPAERLVAN